MDKIATRLQVVKAALEIGSVKAAALYGFSRKTVSIWVKKFNASGINGLKNSAKEKYNNPETMPDSIVEQILDLKRKNPSFSANKIKTCLNIDYSLTAINKKIRQASMQTRIINTQNMLYGKEYFLTVRPVSNFTEFKYFIGLTSKLTGAVIPGYLKEINISAIRDFLMYIIKQLESSQKIIVYHNLTYLNKGKTFISVIDDINSLELFYKQGFVHPDLNKIHNNELHNYLLDQQISTGTILVALWQIYNYKLTTNGDSSCRIYYFCSENSSPITTDSVITALQCLTTFYRSRSEQDSQILIYQILLDLVKYSADKSLHISIIQKYAQLSQKNGRHDEALKALKQAEVICLLERDDSLYARNCGLIGISYQQTGKYTQAARFLNQQYEISLKINDQNELCQSCLSLGVLYGNQAIYGKARKFYDQALEAAVKLGKKNIRLTVLGNIGVLYWHRGKLKDANEYFKAAYNMAMELNNQRQVARMLGNLGAVQDEMYQYQAARSYYKKQLEIAEKHSIVSLQTAALGNLGCNYLTCGENKESLSYLSLAYDLASQTNDLEKQIVILGELAALYKKLDKIKTARSSLNKAIVLCNELNDCYYRGGFYLQLAELDFNARRFKEAISSNRKAEQLLSTAARANLLVESRILTIKINMQMNKLNGLAKLEELLSSCRSAESKAFVRKAIIENFSQQLTDPEKKDLAQKLIVFYRKMSKLTGLKYYADEIDKLA